MPAAIRDAGLHGAAVSGLDVNLPAGQPHVISSVALVDIHAGVIGLVLEAHMLAREGAGDRDLEFGRRHRLPACLEHLGDAPLAHAELVELEEAVAIRHRAVFLAGVVARDDRPAGESLIQVVDLVAIHTAQRLVLEGDGDAATWCGEIYHGLRGAYRAPVFLHLFFNAPLAEGQVIEGRHAEVVGHLADGRLRAIGTAERNLPSCQGFTGGV